VREDQWTQQQLIPLLRLLGFRNIHFTGGASEMGRDVVFADYDRFAILRYFAAQVKSGDVRASGPDRELSNLVDQLRIAYDSSYTEPSNGREFRMSGVYLITKGNVTDYAKRYLREKTGQWLHVIDGDGLETARFGASTRVSDAERAGRIAMLSTDLEFRIIPVATSVTETIIAGPTVVFRPNVISTLSLEKFLDIAIVELDPFDLAILMRLHSVLVAFNGMFLKLPIGSSDQSVLPTVEGYRKVAMEAKSIALECMDLLKYVLQHPRPEPGVKLSRSGIAGRTENSNA
jgi:hypothetical protein